jgi:hypothetical protein
VRHQLALKAVVKKPWNLLLLCLLLLNPDDSLFWPLSFLHFIPVALTTSDQCSFYFIFSNFFYWSVSIENLNSRGGSSNRMATSKKIIKKSL